jgi:hypothetical protein
MRYCLSPNKPVKIKFDPWGIELECPFSVYFGSEEQEIRVWGRRRILILERLIQIAKKFTVYLMGQGMPSFYVADLGHMSFTLGLSGWTANDWAAAGNFDLMAPRADVDNITKQNVFEALKLDWFNTPENVAKKLNIDKSMVLGALGAYTQAGRAIFDLNKQVYRVRELSRDPLPMDKLRFSSPKEEKAGKLILENQVKIDSVQENNGNLTLKGTITEFNDFFYPTLTIDPDQKISVATCSCSWYTQNKLYKGPCEHMLALRILHGKHNSLSERR